MSWPFKKYGEFIHKITLSLSSFKGLICWEKVGNAPESFISEMADLLKCSWLPVTFLVVLAVCAALGIVIERLGLRPLAGSARIAPLLATIGISLVLDQLLQLGFSPDPRALPSPLPTWRIPLGGGTIGALM